MTTAATTTRLPYNVYQAGQKCSNNQYLWHRIDGYCKECCPKGFSETNEQVKARRNAKGYQ